MAASNLPPSLGDDRTEYVLNHETHPLPSTRRELVARLETLLGQGGVQKIIVEVGRPLQIYRLQPKDETLLSPPELPPDDLWMRTRNGELEEFMVRKDWQNKPFHVLFLAFQELSRRKLRPRAVFVHHYGLLRAWFGFEEREDVAQVFGVDTIANSTMPEEAVILVASSFDDQNPDVFGLRIPID